MARPPEPRVFLDTDVILDHLGDRQPFAESAHRLLALAEMKRLVLCVSTLSFSNLYYLLRKWKGQGEAMDLLRRLGCLVQVVGVPPSAVASALESRFPDFEDALQYFAAESAGQIDIILTRNISDYATARIPVLTPDAFLRSRDSVLVG